MSRYGQWHEFACRITLQVLVLLTDLTASHILTYGNVHARPPVHALHIVNGPVMACIVGVMQLTQYRALELRDVGHHKCRPLVD